MNTFTGIEVHQNSYMPKTQYRQWRFPRSKKKRIQKKWSKQKANWRYDPCVWRIGGVYYVHPEIYEMLKVMVNK